MPTVVLSFKQALGIVKYQVCEFCNEKVVVSTAYFYSNSFSQPILSKYLMSPLISSA
jgi:hypothetical protein